MKRLKRWTKDTLPARTEYTITQLTTAQGRTSLVIERSITAWQFSQGREEARSGDRYTLVDEVSLPAGLTLNEALDRLLASVPAEYAGLPVDRVELTETDTARP